MNDWQERALARIPGATQTFSKRRDQFPANAPTHLVRGRAAHVWDYDGREYIDWTMALGAIVLGYDDPDVSYAVLRQVRQGTVFGLPHPVETLLAEELVDLMPWPDVQFRYGKNGSDATSGAVRAARAITGRARVASFGYHGWQDWSCPNQNGIPFQSDMTIFPEGEKHWSVAEVAAVIVEPDAMPVEMLRLLRSQCTAAGTLLIFDEVLTGFRLDIRGAMNLFGVIPDMACFAKAIANGYPLSVIAGPAEIMQVFDGGIGYSFTFGGDTIAIAAALATVRKMKRLPVISHLWAVGTHIQQSWNALAGELALNMPLLGQAPRTVVRYPTSAHKTLVMQEMFKRGIMWTVGATACYAHTDEDVERTLLAIRETLEIVAAAKNDPAKLVEGPIAAEPYRKQVVA